MLTTNRSRLNILHRSCIRQVRGFRWSQVLLWLNDILLLLLRMSNCIGLILNILLRIGSCNMSILIIKSLLTILCRIILMMIIRNQRCSLLTIDKCYLPAHPTRCLSQPTVARLEISQGLHFICSQIILSLMLCQHFILFQKSLLLKSGVNERLLQFFILLYKLMESSLDRVELVPENTLGVTHPIRLHCLLQFATFESLLPPMKR
mmetsp:Transcript_6373/g.10700  ORF Transcript_6373/g.10700 Transcript_6373/m.10700 type:complete len:206 (+) Transcript_6373:85-702(+)